MLVDFVVGTVFATYLLNLKLLYVEGWKHTVAFFADILTSRMNLNRIYRADLQSKSKQFFIYVLIEFVLENEIP